MGLRLPLLHPLLLLGVPLLQLLGLLLMPLLYLLLAGIVGILPCKLLVFLVLSLLQFLPLLLLLRIHLFLLLLIFLFLPGVAGSCGGALHRRKIIGMHRAAIIVFGPRNVSANIVSAGITRAGISRTAMNRATFASRHHSVAAECPRSGSCSDGRLAMVPVCAKLRIGAGLLHLLSLASCRRKAAATFSRFLLRRWTGVDSTIPSVVTDPAVISAVCGALVNVMYLGDVHVVD